MTGLRKEECTDPVQLYSRLYNCTRGRGKAEQKFSLSLVWSDPSLLCRAHVESISSLTSLLLCSGSFSGKVWTRCPPPLRWSSSHRAAVTDFKLPELFRKQVLTVFFFLPSSEQVIQDFIHLSTTLSCGFYLTNFLRGLKSNIQLVVKYYFYTNEV